MTFLPIVDRELRVAARKRSTYWVRTGAGLAVVALGVWLFVVMQGSSQRDISLGLFYVLAGAAVVYALLGGMRTTADCLSEEKREGTLGLLFLTDLRGADVVLGKLVASSVPAFYSVAAVLPMLSIPLLMGGVTGGEYARMALLVMNALFFSLSVGIAVSAMSRIAQRAMLGALVFILFFNLCLPAAGAIMTFSGKARNVATGFLMPSAGFAFYSGLDATYKTSKPPFWISLAVIHGLGWAFLAVASLIAPRSWRDRPQSRRQQSWAERWKLWIYGDAAERRGFRERLLGTNPFYWLASRERIKPALVWGFLALIACGWAWGLAKARRAWLEPGMYVMTAVILNFVLRCWVAAEATRQVAEDRKQGTLELLLSTPLRVEEILAGQRLALLRQFVGPVVVVLCIEAGFMIATLNEDVTSDAGFSLFLYLGGMTMFVMDMVALYWVGMWLGLSSKNQSRAISGALSRVFVVPWLFIGILMLLLALLPSRAGADPGGGFFLGAWILIGLSTDAIFAFTARRQLLEGFRTLAQQRFAGKPGFWGRLLGGR